MPDSFASTVFVPLSVLIHKRFISNFFFYHMAVVYMPSRLKNGPQLDFTAPGLSPFLLFLMI